MDIPSLPFEYISEIQYWHQFSKLELDDKERRLAVNHRARALRMKCCHTGCEGDLWYNDDEKILHDGVVSVVLIQYQCTNSPYYCHDDVYEAIRLKTRPTPDGGVVLNANQHDPRAY